MRQNNSNIRQENAQMQAQNQNRKKFIVLDIVFYGSSLNYDQGSGNLQELKKITKWDGKQYTLVSRYALRYSLLKTGEQLGLWDLAPGIILERSGEGDKTVIQPSVKCLLSGEILKHPDYDFFGYLITGTTPQNSREAPVKISHAISLTPYNYDSHFAGNLDLAKRMVEVGKAEKMDPNLFTVEEHQTYYIYTVVIDVDKIGKNEVYLAKDSEIELERNNRKEKIKLSEITKEKNKLIIRQIEKNKEKKREEIEITNDIQIEVNKLGDKIILLTQSSTRDPRDKISNLIKTILNLNRDIKARKEALHPKLLVLGLYEGKYQTFKDRIRLSNTYEEIYEEEIIPEKKNKTKIKVIKRVIKLKKPVFEIVGGINAKNWNGNNQPPIIDEKEIVESKESIIEKFFNANETGVWIFRSPEITVKKSD